MLSRSEPKLASLENQGAEAATSQSYSTYIYNHSGQLLKGAMGILGLTALGGLVYWGGGWFGGKKQESTLSAAENPDDNGNLAVDVSRSRFITPNDHALLELSPTIPLSTSATNTKITNIDSDIAASKTQDSRHEENSFSTDDLAFRGQAQDQPQQKRQKNYVGSTPTTVTYLPVVELANINNAGGVKIDLGLVYEWGYSGSSVGKAGF